MKKRTTAKTAPFKICDEETIDDCFRDSASANHAFILKHSGRTKKEKRSVLLIHGFSDSPFLMKDIGLFFYKKGFDVVGIRLTGHGTNPDHLNSLRLRHWRDDCKFGLKLAKEYGEKIIVAGLSTGAALLINHIVKKGDGDIDRAILFSPAFKLVDNENDELDKLGSFLPAFDLFPIKIRNFFALNLLGWIIPRFAGERPDSYSGVDYVRYRKSGILGIAQLYRLTRDIKLITRVQSKVPFLTFITSEDTVVVIDEIFSFLEKVEGPSDIFMFVPETHLDNWKKHLKLNFYKIFHKIEFCFHKTSISHAGIMFTSELDSKCNFEEPPERNSMFHEIEKKLEEFIIDNK